MKCFKCEKDMSGAYVGATPWEAPCDGVLFEGGFSFGSGVYDAMSDGVYVEIIICDECLIASKNSDKIREMRKVYTHTRSEPVVKK